MKKIIFTGGGTAGHVTPNIALMTRLIELDWEIHYIGSADGIEKTIITQTHTPFYSISSGKLRRYFDWKNLIDPFRVVKGVFQAIHWIRKIKPVLVFSKGGFVAVPVVIASRLCRVPVIIHESDFTPGLANRISAPFAQKICVTFPETLKYIHPKKAILTGLPIRDELRQGKKEKGYSYCKFTTQKPVLLIIGGSLGSQTLNERVRTIIEPLLKQFQIIHICGKGNIDSNKTDLSGYIQFEYVQEPLADLLAITDIVLSRAGSTTIFECLSLHIPMLLIPLSLQASRGDQILNARSFQHAGFADVLEELQITPNLLLKRIQDVYENRKSYVAKMKEAQRTHATELITKQIIQIAKR